MLTDYPKTRRIIICLASTVLTLTAGCSSDSNPAGGGGGGGGGGNPGAAALQSAQIQPPDPLQNAANADPTGGAATGVGYFDQYNSLTSFSSWLSPPAPVRGHGGATPAADTSWTVGGLTITLSTTESGGPDYTYYAWEVYLDGIDQLGEYNNFLYIFGSHETGTDGGGKLAGPGDDRSTLVGAEAAYILGNMTVYDRANPPEIEFAWTWGVDPIGRTIGTNRYGPYDDPDDITIQVEPDGSGYLEVINNSVVRYRADWLANGTGTWTTYSAGGIQLETGTF